MYQNTTFVTLITHAIWPFIIKTTSQHAHLFIISNNNSTHCPRADSFHTIKPLIINKSQYQPPVAFYANSSETRARVRHVIYVQENPEMRDIFAWLALMKFKFSITCAQCSSKCARTAAQKCKPFKISLTPSISYE